jgi:hypothetical protein
LSENEWIVEAPNALVEELAFSFQMGPVLEDGKRFLTEELVAHLKGLKIQIFSKEHPPLHFRVSYAGETANYSIKDCSQLNGDLKKWYRNIRLWHSENKSTLIETWNKTRPSDCPVGPYREEA